MLVTLLTLLALLPFLGAVISSGIDDSAGGEAGGAPPTSAPEPGASLTSTIASSSDDIIDQIVASGKAEEEAKSKRRAKPTKPGVTSSPVGEGDVNENLASVTPVDPNDPTAIFEAALKDGETEEQPADDADLKDLDPKSRAAETIRNLRARSQEAEGQVQEAQQRAWEYAQTYNQFREQAMRTNGQMREQMAAMQARLQAMEQYGAVGKQQDPLAQAEQEWLGKIENVVAKRVSPLEAENRQLREQMVQQQRDRQLGEIKQRHSFEANKAVSEVLLKNTDPEAAKELAPMMRKVLFAIAADTNTSIPEAAKMTHRLFMKYAVAYLKGQAKSTSPQRERSQAVPRQAPKGRPGSDGESEPSYDLLKHNGLDLAAWHLAGKPPLRPLPRG